MKSQVKVCDVSILWYRFTVYPMRSTVFDEDNVLIIGKIVHIQKHISLQTSFIGTRFTLSLVILKIFNILNMKSYRFLTTS